MCKELKEEEEGKRRRRLESGGKMGRAWSQTTRGRDHAPMTSLFVLSRLELSVRNQCGCLVVCLSGSPSACQPYCQFIPLSVCLSVRASVCPAVCLSVTLCLLSRHLHIYIILR